MEVYENSIIFIESHYITNNIIEQLKFCAENSSCINIFFGNNNNELCEEFPFTFNERKDCIRNWCNQNHIMSICSIEFHEMDVNDILTNIGYASCGDLKNTIIVTGDIILSEKLPQNLNIYLIGNRESVNISELFFKKITVNEIKNTLAYYESENMIPYCTFNYLCYYINTTNYYNIKYAK